MVDIKNYQEDSDKVLPEKAFAIPNNLEFDGYQSWLISIVYVFFNKKSRNTTHEFTTRTGIYNAVSEKQQLDSLIQKPMTRIFEKHKVIWSFQDNFWGSDHVDRQLISKHNKRVKFLLCVIDIYCKYTWLLFRRTKKYYNHQCVLTNSSKSGKFWFNEKRTKTNRGGAC